MARSKIIAKDIRCPDVGPNGRCNLDVMEEMRVYERQRIRSIEEFPPETPGGIPPRRVARYLKHRDSDDFVDELVGYRCEDGHEWSDLDELLADLKKVSA